MHRLFDMILILHVDELVQEGNNFIANTLEFRLSWTGVKYTQRDMHTVGAVMCFILVVWHCTTVHTHFMGKYFLFLIQYGAVITRLIHHKRQPISSSLGRDIVSFVIENSDLCNVWSTAVSYQISCYIGQLCNCTLPYLQTKRRIMTLMLKRGDNRVSPAKWKY